MRNSKSFRNNEPPVFTKMYEMTSWLFGRVEGFPRVFQRTLGERLLDNALRTLEALTAAQFRKDRLAPLSGCNERLDAMRVLLRLAVDSKCLSFRQYEHVTGMAQEVGRMVGGWIAHQKGKA